MVKEKEQKYLRHIGMEAKVQGTSLAAVITVPVRDGAVWSVAQHGFGAFAIQAHLHVCIRFLTHPFLENFPLHLQIIPKRNDCQEPR